MKKNDEKESPQLEEHPSTGADEGGSKEEAEEIEDSEEVEKPEDGPAEEEKKVN